MLTNGLFVQASGCCWEKADGLFGVTRDTAYCWFQILSETGLWLRTYQAILDELGRRVLLNWSRALVGSQLIGAKGGGEQRAKPH
ncbi:hypothetical protein [Nocardiopsis valliformis]|uniref:hypothetical protein n=1 Tax=Nocardiopsis valliformis TaxID=239974 RepID=UPI00034A3985|nr:hypothetical protein [Nocardiopsis valliformis]